jgi:hypothetical protein
VVIYQLTRPFAYIAIRDISKAKIDWLVPAVLTLPTVLAFAALSERPQVFMANGLLSQVAGLVQSLPSFYLAALTAIATFSRPDLDYLLPEPTPTVDVLHRGQRQTIQLTRRRMLAMQFGYLTLLSLMLFGVILAANAAAPTIKTWCPAGTHVSLVLAFMGMFSYAVWHMLTITLFGLYQLSDRIHQPDPVQ